MNTDEWLLLSPHGVTWRHAPYARLAAVAVAAAITPLSAHAEPKPGAPDPRITPGQVIDGWTGKPIPCRCRYGGQNYKLGDVVCMRTHLGTVLTRCELFLNNTSWMPTREPCTISGLTSGTFAAAVPGLR